MVPGTHYTLDTRTKPSLFGRVRRRRPPRAGVKVVESRVVYATEAVAVLRGPRSALEELPGGHKYFCIDEGRLVSNDPVPHCEKWLCCHHEKLKISLLSFLFCLSFGHCSLCTSAAPWLFCWPYAPYAVRHRMLTVNPDAASFPTRCMGKSSLISL